MSTKLENNLLRELNETEIIMWPGEQTGVIVQRMQWFLAGSKWVIKNVPSLIIWKILVIHAEFITYN